MCRAVEDRDRNQVHSLRWEDPIYQRLTPQQKKRSEGTGKENKQLTLIGKEKYRNKANESLSRGKPQGQFNRLPPSTTLEVVPGGTTNAQEYLHPWAT